MQLAEVLQAYRGLPEEQRASVAHDALSATKHMRFVPLPGPQTAAYLSNADVLLYGGQAGSGKSFLLMGLGSQEHRRSIIFRREAGQTDGLEEAGRQIIGDTARFNGTDLEWSWADGKSLKLAGMKDAGDWNKHAGRERDLIGYDEAAEFLLEQVASLMAWNRGPEGQRCRIVLATNPPRTADGAWIIEWFAPWLDEHYIGRAKPGELRYAVMIDGKPVWQDGPQEVEIDGERYRPLSFTFIPASLKDNPFRDTPEYRAKLNSLPEPLRSQLLKGLFLLGGEDDPWQVIPTDWAQQAIARWTPKPPHQVPMCCIGVDVAQGGCFDDQTEILTDNGWVLFEQLSGSEQVLTLNGLTAQWGAITQLHRYHHKGPMNLLERPDLNFCITDNHQLLAKSPKGDWKIRRFDALPGDFVIPRTIEWIGRNPESIQFESRLTMPNGGERLKLWKFDFEDWARLLGWFVSEGCAFQEKRTAARWRINIAQNKGEKFERIASLLTRMGIAFYSPKSRSGLEFSISAIGSHLANHCGVHAVNKRIPEYIRNATPVIIRAFLEEYRLGDGSVNGNGVNAYTTSSRLLAGDLHEVLAKLGRAGKMRVCQQAGTSFKIGSRTVIRKRDVFTVTERSVQADCFIQKKNVRRVAYDGMVHCVSTPLKTICVRRNGSVMWSGNSDQTVLAIRYDGWYAPMHAVPGSQTPGGTDVAGLVVAKRRDNAKVVIDIGGGWGGDAYAHLVANGVDCIGYMGVKESFRRTQDNQLKFSNVRSQAYWQFREALNPDQVGGALIYLPNDRELLADLCAPRFDVVKMGIKVEPKVDVTKRLGRSPDKADATVMAWFSGAKAITHATQWSQEQGGRRKTLAVDYGPRRPHGMRK